MGNQILTTQPLVDPVNRFALFINGKSGNTTLKLWFFENLDFFRRAFSPSMIRFLGPEFYARMALRPHRFYRLLLAGQRRNADLRVLSQLYMDSTRKRLPEAEVLSMFKFIVVRHPCDRIVSSFLDKFCGEDREMPWVREVIGRAGTGGAITFAQFLAHLDGIDIRLCNPHWRAQNFAVENVPIDAVVRLEALREGFAAIADRTGSRGAPFLREARQKTVHDGAEAWGRLDPKAMTNLEIVEAAQRIGGMPPKALFLDDAAIAVIARVYASDFARFGYDPARPGG